MLIDIAMLLIAISNLLVAIKICNGDKPIPVIQKPLIRLNKRKTSSESVYEQFEKDLAEWSKSLEDM